jgi:hypothetical protein
VKKKLNFTKESSIFSLEKKGEPVGSPKPGSFFRKSQISTCIPPKDTKEPKMAENPNKNGLPDSDCTPDRIVTVHAKRADGTFEEESRMTGSKKYNLDLRDGTVRPIKQRKSRQKSIPKMIDKKTQSINLTININNLILNQINLIDKDNSNKDDVI